MARVYTDLVSCTLTSNLQIAIQSARGGRKGQRLLLWPDSLLFCTPHPSVVPSDSTSPSPVCILHPLGGLYLLESAVLTDHSASRGLVE